MGNIKNQNAKIKTTDQNSKMEIVIAAGDSAGLIFDV